MRKFFIGCLCLVMSFGVFAFGQNVVKAEVGYELQGIRWSDADSGRAGSLKFRLANIDAGETGRLNMKGGAKCHKEIERGKAAKNFIVNITRGKEIKIVKNYGEDRYGRIVVDLSVNGAMLSDIGVKAGHFKPWPHRNGRALTNKPRWC